MSWIEGIGDEVTITITVLLCSCVLLAAWLSTGTRDIPFIRVIIVQLTRRRVRQQNNSQNQSENNESQTVQEVPNSENDTQEQGSRDVSETASAVENIQSVVDQVNVAEVNNQRNLNDINSQKDGIVSEMNEQSPEDDELSSCNDDCKAENETEEEFEEPSENELRQRRLDFFSGNSQQTSITKDNDSKETPRRQSADEHINAGRYGSQTVPKPQTFTQLASNLLTEELSSSVSEPIGSSVDPADSNIVRQQNETVADNQSIEDSIESEGLPGEIRVRIKFLNDTQRLVTSLPNETIGNFRRKHFNAELSESKLVRFIFNGQDLRNDASTLENYNIIDNSVLHCLVTQPRQQDQHHGNHGDGDNGLDIGMFMFPLFGVLLGIVWYMRFMYRQFFNVTSTLTLGGITFLYIAAFMSSLRGRWGHDHID